jgi:hypothetical protein
VRYNSFSHKSKQFWNAFTSCATQQLKQNIPNLPAKKLPIKVSERY